MNLTSNRNIRIGFFTSIGVAIIVGFSFYVNDHPYWYRPCKKVAIHVDDATGLRRKSPVKTLGLEIGFIDSVTLDKTMVLINVCITAPVKILPDTKAYVRTLGFLGDRFLELRPVELQDSREPATDDGNQGSNNPPVLDSIKTKAAVEEEPPLSKLMELIIPTAYAEEEVVVEEGSKNNSSTATQQNGNGATTVVKKKSSLTLEASRETELQDLLKKVGKLVDQLNDLVSDIHQTTSQQDFKEVFKNLNHALKNLSDFLEPNGNLVKDVKSAATSLKTTMKSAEEVLEKVNRGDGTLAKVINDPELYEEAKAALKNINMILGKAGKLNFYVDLSAISINAYDGTRATLQVEVEPNSSRYYLLGLTSDPRGRINRVKTETITNGVSNVQETITTDEKGLKITAMFGKYFGPLDLRAGILNDAGAVGAGFWFDPQRRFGIQTDIFKPSKEEPITARIYGRAQFFMALYATAGVDSIHKYYVGSQGISSGTAPTNNNYKLPYFWGFGLYFNDEDLKYLFSLR